MNELSKEVEEYMEGLEKKYEKMDNLVKKVSRSRDVEITRYWISVSKRFYDNGKESYEENNFVRSKALLECADAVIEGAIEALLRGGV
jgi:hypothetical protein